MRRLVLLLAILALANGAAFNQNYCNQGSCCTTNSCNSCASSCPSQCATESCTNTCVNKCIQSSCNNCNSCGNCNNCGSSCSSPPCQNNCTGKCTEVSTSCSGGSCNSCIGNQCCTNATCNKCVNQCSQGSGCTHTCVQDCIKHPIPDKQVDHEKEVVEKTVEVIGVNTTHNHTNKINITTTIHIHNIINNTNLVDVPIKINTTNINNMNLSRDGGQGSKEIIHVTGGQQSQTQSNCCYVLHPRECFYVNETGGQRQVKCIRRRHRECSSICSSSVVLLVPPTLPYPPPQPSQPNLPPIIIQQPCPVPPVYPQQPCRVVQQPPVIIQQPPQPNPVVIQQPPQQNPFVVRQPCPVQGQGFGVVQGCGPPQQSYPQQPYPQQPYPQQPYPQKTYPQQPYPQPQIVPYPVQTGIQTQNRPGCHFVQQYPWVYCGNYQKYDCGLCYYCGQGYQPQVCSAQSQCPTTCRNNLYL